MIQSFVDAFMAKKKDIEGGFSLKHPEKYADIVRAVVEAIGDDEDYSSPDPNRIHEIDDGDYQGILVYVIGARGYQPSKYWAVLVDYGTCSQCDTLEGIRDSCKTPPTPEQVGDYMTLALHIVQALKLIGDDPCS